ncbi:HBR389Cp [Eremothecium sinecaudum]|uniref:GPI ethanolamine phosphate transferase 2 n=1 Tax=Eremothecium sinecaudum TaxID=45286 RepID=A0A120K1E3_9SACH|nr:HBR389Cp [Eremothecium sinecaudum]AMD19290.1 HBR389Cp [Eremothecium sinecaudum]
MMLYRFIALLLCQIVALLTFAVGFFPQKVVLKGDADFKFSSDAHRNINSGFDRLVLVVIDALRSDFLFDRNLSNFHFVHELMNRGEAWGFTAYSNPPTVTLPRLKGITTGSMPNFLDAILNVAEDDKSSNLKEQDSWIRQFQRQGKKIHFYGDDTWLKLFPLEFFEKYEGTNSFFVSDFEIVDNNVTRHLPDELLNKDWDALILHYLGLDHIGHKQGPLSQFMPAKHMEMDSIVKRIYESVDDRTLICVMGDHGMNELGNHGGSSAGETSAALVMISKMLKDYPLPAAQSAVEVPLFTDEDYQYLTAIQQVDLVPTIASLFNVPVPKNNLGVLIKEFLPLFEDRGTLKLKENYHQLMHLAGKDTNSTEKNIQAMLEEMKSIQGTLAHAVTNYDYKLLTIGVALMFVVTAITCWIFIRSVSSARSVSLSMAISVLLGTSMFSSSFVEEEHQFWWWVLISVIGYSWVNNLSYSKSHFVLIVCARLIRGWNNSGQKYFYEYTAASLLDAHPDIKWAIIAVTTIVVGTENASWDPLWLVASISTAFLCMLYKSSWAIVNGEQVPLWLESVIHFILKTESSDTLKPLLIPVARWFFQLATISIVTQLLYCKYYNKQNIIKTLSSTINIVLIFQTNPSNIPLFLIFFLMKKELDHLLEDLYVKDTSYIASTISLIMENFTFFQFGGTNSIATIDLTNAYNGVSENYSIYTVGLLMCLSNFAPVISWILYSLTCFQSYKNNKSYQDVQLSHLFYYCITGLFLLLACITFRYHLFIWSVFCPKLCYFIGWNVIIHGILENIVGPILLKIAQ